MFVEASTAVALEAEAYLDGKIAATPLGANSGPRRSARPWSGPRDRARITARAGPVEVAVSGNTG